MSLNFNGLGGSTYFGSGINFGSTYGNNYISSAGMVNALNTRKAVNDTSVSITAGYDAQDALIENDITNIASQLKHKHADKAAASFQQLINHMKTYTQYANMSDAELRAYARKAIETTVSSQQGEQADLAAMVRDCADNSFEQGLFINWDGDTLSQNDLLKLFCDMDEEAPAFQEATSKVAGHAVAGLCGVAGGAATGAAIGAIGGPIGALGGAIIGGIIGVVASLF